MDIKLGSAIWTRTGEPCGSIQRVIVDPASRKVDSLVVEYGPAGAVVVPISLVSRRDDRLVVDATRAEIAGMPRFVVVDYCLPTTEGLAWQGATTETPCPVLWTRVPPSLAGEQHPTPLPIEHVAVSDTQAVIDKGMRVECLDGRCGEVSDVIAECGALAGIMVRRGFVFGRDLLIPPGWIERVEGAAVHLRATREQVEKLAESEAKHEWDQPP
ncbi:MAG: PRC-barrel domain-containing protein [Candidatus Sericytochromatia bacterium]|nr:PRC-barrel domain-containing protein [Candidatus Tanganyikabacteria bacterium]